MPEKWTGDLVGRMHNEEISCNELAAELCMGKSYVSMILSGKRTPPGAKERFEAAFEAILQRKEKEQEEA